jgi:hypothetical protein
MNCPVPIADIKRPTIMVPMTAGLSFLNTGSRFAQFKNMTVGKRNVSQFAYVAPAGIKATRERND